MNGVSCLLIEKLITCPKVIINGKKKTFSLSLLKMENAGDTNFFFFFLYYRDFELPLPGDLPESVEHDLGEVYYRLKAVVERPTFSMNYNDRKMLRVSRVLLPSSLELTQSLVISNIWIDKLSYDISVPSKVFSMGSLIPITFALTPIAHDLRVRSVSCVLKEYTTLSAEDHSKMEGRVIKHLRDENFASGPDPWTKTELLPVPDYTSHLIQTDSLCDLIKIKHKLKFTVSLTNADGHISGMYLYKSDDLI